MQEADQRLAVCGSLAPGESNHDQLDGLRGRWIPGEVRGTLTQAGWGAHLGFPGLRLDSETPVPVQVFESGDLPANWDRLDAFEGESYRRVTVDVSTEQGLIRSQIYVLA